MGPVGSGARVERHRSTEGGEPGDVEQPGVGRAAGSGQPRCLVERPDERRQRAAVGVGVDQQDAGTEQRGLRSDVQGDAAAPGCTGRSPDRDDAAAGLRDETDGSRMASGITVVRAPGAQHGQGGERVGPGAPGHLSSRPASSLDQRGSDLGSRCALRTVWTPSCRSRCSAASSPARTSPTGATPAESSRARASRSSRRRSPATSTARVVPVDAAASTSARSTHRRTTVTPREGWANAATSEASRPGSVSAVRTGTLTSRTRARCGGQLHDRLRCRHRPGPGRRARTGSPPQPERPMTAARAAAPRCRLSPALLPRGTRHRRGRAVPGRPLTPLLLLTPAPPPRCQPADPWLVHGRARRRRRDHPPRARAGGRP